MLAISDGSDVFVSHLLPIALPNVVLDYREARTPRPQTNQSHRQLRQEINGNSLINGHKLIQLASIQPTTRNGELARVFQSFRKETADEALNDSFSIIFFLELLVRIAIERRCWHGGGEIQKETGR